jgi:comEA protein
MGFSFRLPRIRFPRIPLPVLTAAEKTALISIVLVLGTGSALRVWERSGVKIGPVTDWEGLRALVIRSRDQAGDAGAGTFPCADDAPGYSGNVSRGEGPATYLAGSGKPKKRESGSSKKKPPSKPLDLNSAGERALLNLPGVGPSTAKAIIAHRTVQGRFRTVDDLLQVKGIGPKKLEALRPYVSVPVAAAAPEKTQTLSGDTEKPREKTVESGAGPPGGLPSPP